MARSSLATANYEVPSVRRGGAILRTLAAAGPLGISELSRTLRLPKASVFRIVTTLESEGFVERVDGDRFEVGRSAFEVGAAYTRRFDLESAFRKVARRLIDEHNETVQMAILVGTEVLYMAKEDSSQAVRLVSRLGTRLPASATSLGKALLSSLPEENLRSLFPAGRLTQLTPNSHASLSSLVEELQLVRERGWAHDSEEASLGLQCVGSVIRDGLGRPVAAISISAPSQRMSAEQLARLGEAVREAAADISLLLGYHPEPHAERPEQTSGRDGTGSS